MTTPHLSIEAATETLFATDELITLAAEHAAADTPRRPAPAEPAAPPPDTLPLGELLGALDAHAHALPRPLPTTHSIPLPAGIPARFAAPLDLITPGRYQPRTQFDAAELDELAASIAEHGILNPLLVFASEAGKLELVAGERRLRAARQIGLAFVPVDVRSYTLRQVAEISGLDNIQRANLSAAEEGAYYNRLMAELGISENELSKRLGKNRAYIQQRRAIASAAPEVLAALASSELTFSQARAIAQAAPGQTKAQSQALTKVRELVKNGKRVTETDAKNAAEKIVLSKAKKDLEALGWQVAEPYGGFTIWAPSEKPRQWTGAEIIEAVATQRRPSSELPPAAADAATLQALKTRYHVTQDHKPWIGLSIAYELPTFYAPAELPAIVDQVQRDVDALTARAAAAGWTLKIDASGIYSLANFVFSHPKGAKHSVWGMAEAEKGLAGIEAGKIKTTPAPGYQSPTYKCEQCKKEIRDYEFVDGRKLCKADAKKARAAIEARKERIAADVRHILEPWLQTAPPDALRLLVAAFRPTPYSPGDREKAAAGYRAARGGQLMGDLLATVVERADQYHDHPVYDAATARAPKAQRVLTEWSDDEAASYVGQAPRAADSLDADGYATVAQAVRLLAQALAPADGVLPGSTPAAPGQAPTEPPTAVDGPASAPGALADPGEAGAGDTPPIDRIRAALDSIAAWWDTIDETTPAEEIRVNLAELRALDKDLETYADAPDVSDAEYEALSHLIGSLTTQLDEVLGSIREEVAG